MEQKLSPTEQLTKAKVPLLKGVKFAASKESESSRVIDSPNPKKRLASDIIHITSTKPSSQTIEELIRSSLTESIQSYIINKIKIHLKKAKQKPVYDNHDQELIVRQFILKMGQSLELKLISQKQFDLIVTEKKATLTKLSSGAFGLSLQKNLDNFYNIYDPKSKVTRHEYAEKCAKSSDSLETINHLVIALLSPSRDVQDLIIIFQNDNFVEALKQGDFERATLSKLKDKANDSLLENAALFIQINEWLFKNFRLIFLIDYVKINYNLENICDLIAASFQQKNLESITKNQTLFDELSDVNKQIASYFKDKIQQKMIYWESPRSTPESPRSGSTSSSQLESPRVDSPRTKISLDPQDYSLTLRLIYSKLFFILSPQDHVRSRISRSFSQGSPLKNEHSSTTSLSGSKSSPSFPQKPLELSFAYAIRDKDLSANPDSGRSISFGSPK